MKGYSEEAIAALESGDGIDSGAVAFYCAPTPVRVWGGYGEITLDAEVYKPIGDRGLVSATGGALGGQAQNITLTASGIDPEVMAVFNATSLRDCPVKIWRLLFDSSGAKLLDARVFHRGRLDQIPRDDAEDGTVTIRAIIETAALGLGRRSARRRSDADQRLIAPTDGAFRAVSYAPNKTLYWGGKPPERAGSAIPDIFGLRKEAQRRGLK